MPLVDIMLWFFLNVHWLKYTGVNPPPAFFALERWTRSRAVVFAESAGWIVVNNHVQWRSRNMETGGTDCKADVIDHVIACARLGARTCYWVNYRQERYVRSTRLAIRELFTLSLYIPAGKMGEHVPLVPSAGSAYDVDITLTLLLAYILIKAKFERNGKVELFNVYLFMTSTFVLR